MQLVGWGNNEGQETGRWEKIRTIRGVVWGCGYKVGEKEMESRGFRVDHIEIVKKIEIQWRKYSTSEEEWVEGRMFQHFGKVVRKMMEGTQQATHKGTVPVTRWMMHKWEEEKIEAWERAEQMEEGQRDRWLEEFWVGVFVRVATAQNANGTDMGMRPWCIAIAE